jgi:hypothetical protein
MFRYLFYPGVIIHEFSHALACLLLGVKISKISFGLKESYVKHEAAGPIRMSLVALSPFYFGFGLGIFLFWLAKAHYISEIIWFVILNYLSICILYNSIPSTQDTKNISNAIEEQVKKDWKKGFGSKLLVLIKVPLLYLPIFLISQLVSIFDKFEIIRAFYVLFCFCLVYGLIQ